jgi:hypothetical protein
MFRSKRIPTYLTAANRGRESRVAAEDACSVAMWAFSKRKCCRLAFDGRAIIEDARQVVEGGLIGIPADTTPKLVTNRPDSSAFPNPR